MGGLGAFNPAPHQLGGAAQTDLEAIQSSLEDALGTALRGERGTVQWVENHATARVLWDLYRATQRLANQWDPARMTDFLARWEGILGLRPMPYATLASRREAVGAKLSLIGAGTSLRALRDYLAVRLDGMFVDLAFMSPSQAVSYVPGGGSIPGGPTLLDGAVLGDQMSPFTSTLGYLTILLHKPASMSDVEFYDRAGSIYDEIDGLVGAWMDFAWVRDGVNGAGFYLDEDFNLDNQRFDE